jgi:hypothetical protein
MSNKPNRSWFECSPKDMKYLLFGKKRCPNCNNKLEKKKLFEENVYYERKVSNGKTIYSPGGMPVKDIYYEFICSKCGYIRKVGRTYGTE